MSLVRKAQEGAKTPALYTMYGDQYSVDDLQRDADGGLDEELLRLERGVKDQIQFREAYNNIMSGIRDGSITYSGGTTLSDASGKYYNYYNQSDKDKKDLNKDYYGLMGNYIVRRMKKAKKWVNPEDKAKTKWNGSASIGNALIRELYNSDQENIRDFIDNDTYDETLKKRGVTRRTKRLSEAFESVSSKFDKLFTGYTDADKADALAYINDAIKSLNDGSIDAGDYLALSRAASGLNYRGMFSGEKELATPDEVAQTPPSHNSPEQNQRQAFINWIEQKYPQFTGTLQGSRSLTTGKTYGPGTLSALSTAMAGLSNNDLYRIVRSALSDPKYTFNNEQVIKNTFKDADYGFLNPFGLQKALEALKGKGLLHSFGEDNLNLYYVPNTDNSSRQTAWVWDDKAGTISEMSYHDIPYWREKIKQEWLASNGGTADNSYWASRYFKLGGVVKAYNGTQFTSRIGSHSNVDYQTRGNIANTKANESSVAKWDDWFDLNKMLTDFGTYQSGGQGVPTPFSYAYARGADGKPLMNEDNTPKYGLTTDQFVETLNQLGDIGTLFQNKKYADTGYRNWNNLFDQTGFNEYFGGTSGNFDRLGPSTWNRNAFLGKLRDAYGETNPMTYGDDKIYFDGTKWSKVIPQSQAEVPEIPSGQDPVVSTTSTPAGTSTVDPSKINLTIGDVNKPRGTGQGFWNSMLGLAPDFIGAGRLALSLNTNARVDKTLYPSLGPVLKGMKHTFLPVTGAWDIRQSGYRNAGNMESRFSKALTSDADLYTRTMLDAYRLGNAERSKADLVDNQKRSENSKAAIAARIADRDYNLAVADENLLRINQSNRERAQMKVSHMLSDYKGINGAAKAIEERSRIDLQEKELARKNAMQNALAYEYQDAMDNLNRMYKESNPTATTSTMLDDTNYTDAVKALRRQYQYNIDNFSIGNTKAGYYENFVPRSYNQILGSYTFSAKKGGQLNPNALYLINKVIRNENNT